MTTFVAGLEAAASPLASAVRDASATETPLRVRGAGSWMDANRPVASSASLNVRAHSGIVEYVPGDLTMTARAGTPFAELRSAATEHGQWVPLDPPATLEATIGAVAATASSGPLSHAFGGPRDQIIGLGFVTGRGEYVRGGGRVVKNVAGFDLTRLIVGSWGTLGVVADVTIRLRATPEEDRAFALTAPGDAAGQRAMLQSLRDAQLDAVAMEWLDARAARHALGTTESAVIARFAGNQRAVAKQRETIAVLGEVREVDPEAWSKLAEPEPAGSTVVRYSARPGELASLWRSLSQAVEPARGHMHSTISRGVVRCVIPQASRETLRSLPAPEPGRVTRIFERLPADAWAELAPSPAADRLSSRARDAFDPLRILNRGILGETMEHA